MTYQPDRGILRAMVVPGAGAATTGPSEPGNKRTFRGELQRHVNTAMRQTRVFEAWQQALVYT